MEVFEESRKETIQRILVTPEGVRATIRLQERAPDEAWTSDRAWTSDGVWTDIVDTVGWIGRNGLGKTWEGDGKTPVGYGRFLFGFGIKENPGTVFPYIRVNSGHYLVDDVSSRYYNQIVSEEIVRKDWKSAEHLADMGRAYHYALVTDYNISCESGKGSGIFLHCEEGRPTAGCIAVPEEKMKEILQRIQRDCVLRVEPGKGYGDEKKRKMDGNTVSRCAGVDCLRAAGEQ